MLGQVPALFTDSTSAPENIYQFCRAQLVLAFIPPLITVAAGSSSQLNATPSAKSRPGMLSRDSCGVVDCPVVGFLGGFMPANMILKFDQDMSESKLTFPPPLAIVRTFSPACLPFDTAFEHPS